MTENNVCTYKSTYTLAHYCPRLRKLVLIEKNGRKTSGVSLQQFLECSDSLPKSIKPSIKKNA